MKRSRTLPGVLLEEWLVAGGKADGDPEVEMNRWEAVAEKVVELRARAMHRSGMMPDAAWPCESCLKRARKEMEKVLESLR